MNNKSFLEKILDKWPVKVVCLIVSIFLYIFHQTSVIDKRNVVIPLKIIEDGLVMHVGTSPSTVAVVVRGNSGDVKSVNSSDFTATVNLNEITEKGDFILPVKISLSQKLMEYDPFEVKLKDHQVEISVDLKEKKYVELVPSVVGDVLHGYTISSIEMTPSYIEVSGPKSVLDKIDKIYTTKINVSNAKNTFSAETSSLELAHSIKIEEEGPYKATVIINPLDFKKEFTDVPVNVVNLSDNLEIVSVLPKIRVTLAGSMPDLEGYELPQNVAQIDFSKVLDEGVYLLPVKVKVLKKFEVADQSAEKINVKVVRKFIEKESEDVSEDEKNLWNEEMSLQNATDSKDFVKNDFSEKSVDGESGAYKDFLMNKVDGAVNNMIQSDSAQGKKE